MSEEKKDSKVKKTAKKTTKTAKPKAVKKSTKAKTESKASKTIKKPKVKKEEIVEIEKPVLQTRRNNTTLYCLMILIKTKNWLFYL